MKLKNIENPKIFQSKYLLKTLDHQDILIKEAGPCPILEKWDGKKSYQGLDWAAGVAQESLQDWKECFEEDRSGSGSLKEDRRCQWGDQDEETGKHCLQQLLPDEN